MGSKTSKLQDRSNTPFQLSIHPNNVHPIHNHSNTLTPCMHSMHSLCYARTHNHITQHTMSPRSNDILRALDTHTQTTLYMFIHIVSNIHPSLTCVHHALSLLHLHASFNGVSLSSRNLTKNSSFLGPFGSCWKHASNCKTMLQHQTQHQNIKINSKHLFN